MVAAAVLNFRNFKFLTVGTVKRVELRQHAEFRQNRSTAQPVIHCRKNRSIQVTGMLIACDAIVLCIELAP